jgi:transposase
MEEGRDPEPSACALDSRSVQSAEGGEAISFDKFKHCRGRKEHLAVDTLGFLCERMVTGAGASDRAAGREVLARVRERCPDVGLCWVDGGYANKVDASFIPWARENTGIEVVVVKRTDDAKGFQVLPWRWVVERTNAWIAAHRRLARDYERLVECSEAMIDLAMIDVMAARLAGGTTWSHWRDMVTEPSVVLHKVAIDLRNTLLACYLTLVACVVRSCLCCPACRGDMRRPPLDDLRVPAKKPGDRGGGRGFHYVLARGRG